MKTLTPAKMVMFVFVAIGMLITFYLVKTLTAKEPQPQRVTTRNVPLTLTELEPGTVIKQGDIGMGPAPANEIVGDVLLAVEALEGRVVKNRIPVTELIHGSDLYPAGQLPPLKVSDGATAFSIVQSETSAMVEGLIKPGDHVDIYYSPNATNDPRFQSIGSLTIKLFKGLRVIAINRSFVQSDLEASRNSVTVEVRKDDAALLQLALNTGKLSLSYTRDMSGRATVQVADPDRPTLEELLQLPPVPEEPEEPEPDRFTTNIWRRGSRQSLSFVNNVPGSSQFTFDQYAPRVPGAAPANGQPGYGPPVGPGGQQPNGVWSPQLTPQPGTLPQGPPPGQERLNPGARR